MKIFYRTARALCFGITAALLLHFAAFLVLGAALNSDPATAEAVICALACMVFSFPFFAGFTLAHDAFESQQN